MSLVLPNSEWRSSPESSRELARPVPLPKLYLPYSLLSDLPATTRSAGRLKSERVGRIRHEVMVHWFMRERSEPLAPYTRLMLRSNATAPEEQRSIEEMVDEFLSADEFHQLRTYLYDRHRTPVNTVMIVPPLPVSSVRPDMATRIGVDRPFSRHITPALSQETTVASPDAPGTDRENGIDAEDRPITDSRVSRLLPVTEFIRLSEEEGYDLPFTVWGYYCDYTQNTRGRSPVSEKG